MYSTSFQNFSICSLVNPSNPFSSSAETVGAIVAIARSRVNARKTNLFNIIAPPLLENCTSNYMVTNFFWRRIYLSSFNLSRKYKSRVDKKDYDHKLKARVEPPQANIPNMTENLRQASNFVSPRSLFVLPNFQ